MPKIRKTQGITVIALVITIVILLILAGITISAITGENGIIGNAGEAKKEAEIANEKEIVEKATVQAMGNNKYGNIEESELQEQIDRETGEGKTEVADVGDEFEVVFNESNRYYTVDKDGNVDGAYEIIEDKHPGDITVGKDGETLDGNTEDTAYQIWCIEDLCAFSNQVNNGTNFVNKNVKLMRDLNFNSNLSYVNGNISVDGNIQSCQSIEELKKLLTENEGFYPIGNENLTTGFSGTFHGNNKTIKNIYINRPDMSVGLFGGNNSNNSTIKNLTISGKMIGGSAVGAIFASVRYGIIKIENCMSNVNLEGTDNVGGIVGINQAGSSGSVIISNCINTGEINGKNNVGGILGYNYNTTQIINTYNSGNITGTSYAGGIIGYDYRTSKIINSYNLGDVEATSNAGGIAGFSGWYERNIENCYNVGNVSGTTTGGIIGNINISNDLLITQNCYYLNSNISKAFGSWNSSAESLEDAQGLTDTEMKSSEILEKLNNYVTENVTKEDVTLKMWVKGEDGYPIFDNN